LRKTGQTKLHVPIRYGHNNDKTTKIEAAYASVGTAAGNKLSGEYRDNMRIYIVVRIWYSAEFTAAG